MIPLMSGAVSALQSHFFVSLIGKSTIILVVGLLAVALAGRARASVRHLLLAATFTALLILPALALLLPTVSVGILPGGTERAVITPEPTTAAQLPTTLRLAGIAWFAGTALLLALFVSDLLRLRRLRRSAAAWTGAADHLQSLCVEFGVSRTVELLLHPAIRAPVTAGYWRPIILLPPDVRRWSAGELRRALRHELEHIRRGDWSMQLLARLASAWYWYSPLVWVASRRLTLEAERACDDVAATGVERIEYATQLVALARHLTSSRATIGVGIASRSQLAVRVTCLLDAAQRRGRVGPAVSTTVTAAVCVVMLTVAPLRLETRETRAVGGAPQPSRAAVTGTAPSIAATLTADQHRQRTPASIVKRSVQMKDVARTAEMDDRPPRLGQRSESHSWSSSAESSSSSSASSP